MYEVIDLVREAADPTGKGYAAAEKALLKLDETFKSFQEFEKRYNRDRLQEKDFDALERICRADIESPAFYKGEFHWGSHGSAAAGILARHGVIAHLNGDTKQVIFEKRLPDES